MDELSIHLEGDNIECTDSVTPSLTTPTSTPSTQLSKRQKKNTPPEGNRRAAVWNHYTISMVEVGDGKFEPQAKCNYCQKGKYKAIPLYGTSNAKKHLESCAAYKAYVAENPGSVGSNFDQKIYCKKFAEAIMYHAYPLSIVEHVKLRELISYLNPNVTHVSRNTILRYCLIEHNRLKAILSESLVELNSRVCFTCDLWTACTTRGFLTLTAHFVDNNWTLKSRILNFKYFPPPHRGVDIYLFVLALIKDWKLQGKVFSMTCDNASSMDVMISKFKSDVHAFSGLPMSGKFFHVRCCAHVLNLIVKEGLDVIDASVLKVRAAVHYIAGSSARLDLFDKCKADLNSNFVGKLRLDCITRWNSTYLMLKKALEAKDILNLFSVVDSSFKVGISVEEWKIVDFVCKFLEPFYSMTVLFSGSDYPTANLYFLNIVAIEKLLELGHKHEVESIRFMASAMFEKFEKYWSEYSTVLGIAFILDPRYKMRFVKRAFQKLYVDETVEEKIQVIYNAFVEMYKYYEQSSPSPSSSTSVHDTSAQFTMSCRFEDFDQINECVGGATSEVDKYLNADLMPRDPSFDILKYWQSQSIAMPT